MRCRYSLILLLAVTTSVATSKAETYAERYLRQVGNKAILYAGNGQARYPFRPENTYFMFGEEFKRGDIVYGGILYHNVLLNLDAHLDLLYVKSEAKTFPVLMDIDKVSYFTVDGHLYVRAVDCIEGNRQLSGYVEKILEADSCMLLKKTRMVHYETTDGRYVSHHFEEHNDYYLLCGSDIDKIRGKATFTKAFPEKKKALNAAWKQLDLKKKSDTRPAYITMFKTAVER